MYANYPSLLKKHVLVTGGASGIGRELAVAFISQGCRVSVVDIDDRSSSALVKDMDSSDLQSIFADLRSGESFRQAYRELTSEFGGVDILVNNAARDDRMEFLSMDDEMWREAMATNLDHFFFASQEVCRDMKSRGCGALINMGSVSWMRGRPGMLGYTTAKAGIHGMTRTLARELGPYGIRVNSVVPGAVKTPRQDELWVSNEVEETILKDQALKLRLLPSDIARVVLFVASDQARGCTGQNFVVDAGISLN